MKLYKPFYWIGGSILWINTIVVGFVSIRTYFEFFDYNWKIALLLTLTSIAIWAFSIPPAIAYGSIEFLKEKIEESSKIKAWLWATFGFIGAILLPWVLLFAVIYLLALLGAFNSVHSLRLS